MEKWYRRTTNWKLSSKDYNNKEPLTMSSFGVNSSIDSVASGYFMTEFKKRVFLFTLFY